MAATAAAAATKSGSAVTRGAFILFEGVDRCGKTTQCKRLLEWLRCDKSSGGFGLGADKVEFMRFPDRT